MKTPKPYHGIILASLLLAAANVGVASPEEPAVVATEAESPVELGKINWHRDFEAAAAESRKTGRPLMVLFDEVPGCGGCKSYGKVIFSNPLFVEAAETLFIPIFVRNNDPVTTSADNKLLMRFKERAWSYPVVRFMNAEGQDIAPATRNWRVNEGAWADLLGNMTKALEAADTALPKYRQVFIAEYGARKTAKVCFAMGCYWSGEAKLGALPGVVRTRIGYHNLAPSAREIVEVVYNPEVADFRALVGKAKEFECAQWVILAKDDPHLNVAKEIFGESGLKISSEPCTFKDNDSNYQYSLYRSPGYFFNAITSLQATRMHGDSDNRVSYLSPRQKALGNRINALFKDLGKNESGALFKKLQQELNPSKYRNLYQQTLAEYETTLITSLEKLEAGKVPDTAAPATQDEGKDHAIIRSCKKKDYVKALELATQLTASGPDDAGLSDVILEAAQMLAQNQQLETAADFYKLFAERFPKSGKIQHAHTELAACYYNARQLEQCLGQVKMNLDLYPASPWFEYWCFLNAQVRNRLWRFDEAKAIYTSFLEKYPNGQYSANARADLGRIDPPWDLDAHGMVAYSGKYDDDIRLQAALKATPKHIEDGYAILEDKLGVDLRKHTNVVILFKDGGVKGPRGVKATTRIIGIDNKARTMIQFYTETVVVDAEGFRRTLVHEMKHAGFLEIMGKPYHDLPIWIREGLAVWGSESADDRVRLVLSNSLIAAQGPMSALNGIEGPDQDDRDYLEAVLAFEWLESKKPGNVKAFCRRLIKGEPYREIWADLSGTSYEPAMVEANAHCRKRVKDVLGAAYDAFIPLRKASEQAANQGAAASQTWLGGGGETAMGDWLKENPEHAAAPFARFCLARALITAERHEPGRELLQHIIDHDADRCTLLDDAQFYIGLSYNQQRDAKNAHEAFGVLLRDFPYSMHAKQFIGKLPPAGPVTR